METAAVLLGSRSQYQSRDGCASTAYSTRWRTAASSVLTHGTKIRSAATRVVLIETNLVPAGED